MCQPMSASSHLFCSLITVPFTQVFATLLLMASLPFCFNTAAADGVSIAEEGYKYYCAGERADGDGSKPNALIVLKLREENVRIERKAMVWCSTQRFDLQFIMDRFFLHDDQMIKGGINFKVPVNVDGQLQFIELSTGGGRNYREVGKDDLLLTSKKVCGVSKIPNEDGLFVVGKKSGVCKSVVYMAHGIADKSMDVVDIMCFSDTGGVCSFNFHFKNWQFNARNVPRAFLLRNWRMLRKQFVEEIEKRLVLYIAPDWCIGNKLCQSYDDDFAHKVTN